MTDSSLLTSLFYLQLMWYPYYFISQGLEASAVYITIMENLFMPLGSLIFGFIFDKFHAPLKLMIPLSLSVAVCLQISLCFIPLSEEVVWVWIVIVGMTGLFIGYPWAYLSSTELQLRCCDNR